MASSPGMADHLVRWNKNSELTLNKVPDVGQGHAATGKESPDHTDQYQCKNVKTNESLRLYRLELV